MGATELTTFSLLLLSLSIGRLVVALVVEYDIINGVNERYTPITKNNSVGVIVVLRRGETSFHRNVTCIHSINFFLNVNTFFIDLFHL